MSIKGPKIAWHRVNNDSQDLEKGSFDIRFSEIIEKKKDDSKKLDDFNAEKSDLFSNKLSTEFNDQNINPSNKYIISNNKFITNNFQNQYEEFTIECKDFDFSKNTSSNKNEMKKINFRSKYYDFLKNNSIKYLLVKIKNFYSKFIITIFERLSSNDKNHLSYLFNEKSIESLKLLDYDDSHPLSLIEPEQIKNLLRLHYRLENRSLSFLEKAIKPINNINNSLQTLIIETNQFSKLKEIFNDFGKNFQNLINLHIYLLEKPSLSFEEIIKNLTSKLDYMKNNKQKFLVRNQENEMKIPFRNLTFRNFSNKAKIDAKILLDFFKKMTPAEFGVERFNECFETLNLSQSMIDDQKDDLAKLINGYRMIKVLNISNIT